MLAAERPEAAGETVNVGAREFGTVREDLQALIDARRAPVALTSFPARPAEIALRALELLHVSPLAEWHYKTAHRDSFVDVGQGGGAARLGAEALERRGALPDVRLVPRAPRDAEAAGVTHRVPWNQQALALLKKIS